MSNATDTMIAQNKDWFLECLVTTVNNTGLEIGITLQMDGFLVSGFLVNGGKYFEGFSSEFVTETAAHFGAGEALESIQSAFSTYANMYAPKEGDEAAVDTANYIHLQDARFFNTSGAPIPNNRGMWWRGRISEVNGFILGTLNAQDATESAELATEEA